MSPPGINDAVGVGGEGRVAGGRAQIPLLFSAAGLGDFISRISSLGTLSANFQTFFFIIIGTFFQIKYFV